MSIIGGLRFATLELWDDYPQAGGTRLAFLVDYLPGSEEERGVDGESELRLRFTQSNRAADLLVQRNVIEVFDPGGGSGAGERRHYRIADRAEADWLGAPVIEIRCQPPLVDLADIGLVSMVNNGVEETTLGRIELTIAGHFAFLEAFWTRKGQAHFKGKLTGYTGIVTDEVVAVDANDITSTEYLRAIEAATGLEILTDSSYSVSGPGTVQFGFVERIAKFFPGDGLASRHVVVGETLDRLRRVREAGEYATVIVPRGGTRSGALAPDGVSQVVFRIVSVDAANNRLTIEDPADTDFEVIRWEDQFGGSSDPDLANCYVVDPTDFSLHEIVDTLAASQEIEIADVTNFTAGDLIELRASSADQYVSEIVAVPEYEAQGRRAYPFDRSSIFSNTLRNYVRNPYAREWAAATKPYAVTGKVNGSQTASTVALDGLPPNLTIPDESVLATIGTSGPWIVDGEQTTDGSGTISLVLAGSASLNDNAGVVIFLHQTTAEGLPDRWTPPGDLISAQQRGTSLMAREPGHVGDIVGTINGERSPVNTTTTSDSWRIGIDGLNPGDTIQPGDFIEGSPAGLNLAAVVSRAVADGGGALEVEVVPLHASGYDFLDESSVTIYRPDWDAYLPAGASWAALLATTDTFTNHPSRGVRTPLVPVRKHDSKTSITYAVTFVVYNGASVNRTVTPSSSIDGLRVILRDASGVLATVNDVERTFNAGEFTEVTLQGAYELTASKELQLEVAPFGVDGWYTRADLVTAIADIRIGYGDGTLPLGEHGEQQALYRLAVEKLDANDVVPSAFEGDLRDPSVLAENLVASNQYGLGDTLHLHGPGVAVNEKQRILRTRRDLTDPEHLFVIFGRVPEKLSRKIARLSR